MMGSWLAALNVVVPAQDRAGSRRQLPADSRVFIGRTRQLDELITSARPGSAGSVAYVIDGLAGIGKTAFAVHAAYRLRERFPDGQLFLDLHGHTTGLAPLSAGDALDWLLRCLGVPVHLIPDDLAQRAALYRDRLADTTTLLILDNAFSAAQVRPLLPGAAGCMVLITSRKRLAGLDDAYSITLDGLSEADAVALLRDIAGHGRIPMEHPAACELAALCGHMPLALRIAAARLRHHRARPSAGRGPEPGGRLRLLLHGIARSRTADAPQARPGSRPRLRRLRGGEPRRNRPRSRAAAARFSRRPQSADSARRRPLPVP
jgi:hypothetical protein